MYVILRSNVKVNTLPAVCLNSISQELKHKKLKNDKPVE